MFNGTTGKIITDSGALAANLLHNTGAAVANGVPYFTNTAGRVLADSTLLFTNLITSTTATTASRIATFNANRTITDSGRVIADFLRVDGSTMMTGAFNLNNNVISNGSTI